MFQGLIFGPRINTVKHDAFLAGFDEVLNFGDGLTNDPIVTFGGTDVFSELAFIIGGKVYASLSHFFEDHAAKINLGDTLFSEVVNCY